MKRARNRRAVASGQVAYLRLAFREALRGGGGEGVGLVHREHAIDGLDPCTFDQRFRAGVMGDRLEVGECVGDELYGSRVVPQILRPVGGQVYASGLRNPVGFAWRGDTLWVTVIERDELGNDLVPDYLTRVHEGGFYGWPYSYFGAHVDPRMKPQRPDLVATAIMPDYALGAHATSLGLCDAAGSHLPFGDGLFIGQHGSWNRVLPSGYKVIFLPFEHGAPKGLPIDVLTGFFADGAAHGRPVGVAIDGKGALLVADEVGNTIWRVTATHEVAEMLRAGPPNAATPAPPSKR